MNNDESIYESLKKLYGEDIQYLFNEIKRKIDAFNAVPLQPQKTKLKDINAILITYADTLRGQKAPLSVLNDFLLAYVGSALNTVHILPFFPYSSDDGFSVSDYESVNPDCGNWKDIQKLSTQYYLMFDAVINHISQKSSWFQGFLTGDRNSEDYFITLKGDEDLSKVTRPRATPVMTAFDTENGKKLVWTTFSSDQIDLNYKNPKLLLKIIDLLLFYIQMGADLIRLDAIGYLWKEMGTCCIHLDQTHEIVKLFRSILDSLTKNALLITETNVPHSENISYFGTGKNEAHMVYNFSLPPLVLNAYLQQSSEELNQWVKNLEYPGLEATYFNFLASHDGIGLMPLKGLIPEEKIDCLVKKCLKNNGRISYKCNEDGSQTPYEMNINYYDALADQSHSQELNIKKFLGAYSIAIGLKGIPGIYIHSLLGSENWEEGVKIHGHHRAINREKMNIKTLISELENQESKRHVIFFALKKMLEVRASNKALSYKADQRCIPRNDRLFIMKRSCGNEVILILVNMTGKIEKVNLYELDDHHDYNDLLNDSSIVDEITLTAYDYRWLSRQRGDLNE